MKLKALISAQGVELLERRFLPAFEKIGRVCHLYFTADDLFLMHNVLTADGMQCIAQFPKDLLFLDYHITSQNANRIAFAVDVALLCRALRSGESTQGERLLMKLVKKSPSPNERAMPYLSLESRGFRSAIVQDVPISQPLTRVEVADLQAAIDLVQELPATLVGMPELVHLQHVIERLNRCTGDGQAVEVAVMRTGGLAVRTETSAVSLAAEFRRLPVWDARTGMAVVPPAAAAQQRSRHAGGNGAHADNDDDEADISGLTSRLQQLQEKGEATLAAVNVKHLAKSLHCHLAKPDASFCGVSPQEACLLVMFQFTSAPISLQCRLPLLENHT